MKVRKIPMRTCVITKEKCEKKDLLRIVRTPDGEVIVDLTGKANGRGAYLKKDVAVIKQAEKEGIKVLINRYEKHWKSHWKQITKSIAALAEIHFVAGNTHKNQHLSY